MKTSHHLCYYSHLSLSLSFSHVVHSHSLVLFRPFLIRYFGVSLICSTIQLASTSLLPHLFIINILPSKKNNLNLDKLIGTAHLMLNSTLQAECYFHALSDHQTMCYYSLYGSSYIDHLLLNKRSGLMFQIDLTMTLFNY